MNVSSATALNAKLFIIYAYQAATYITTHTNEVSSNNGSHTQRMSGFIWGKFYIVYLNQEVSSYNGNRAHNLFVVASFVLYTV